MNVSRSELKIFLTILCYRIVRLHRNVIKAVNLVNIIVVDYAKKVVRRMYL